MDFRARHPQPRYYSRTRSLEGAPCPRHDLIKRHKYLVPNSLVVSRGCPHHCDFCYKDAFFKGGKSFYNAPVEQAFCEIDSFPGRHLYFLDDNLFANPTFCRELFKGLHGRGRVWQAAATVEAVLRDELIESAAACGLRSLFIGFETLSDRNLSGHAKQHNHREEYERAIKRLHGLGVMINASFVFGMDHDDSSVFERTVNWAVKQGIETATFHILTPYPGTALYRRLKKEGRITTHDWDLYDTRHCVFRHPKLSASELERGYWWAYQQFYSWKSIVAGALTKPSCLGAVRHMAYAGAWKRCEPLWKAVIQSGMLRWSRPLLETCLAATKAISPGDGMAAKPIIPIQCQSHSPEPKFPWYQPASAQDPTGLVHPRAWE